MVKGTSGRRKRAPGARRSRPAARVSRHVRPEGLTPEEWQRELRRQFGVSQHLDVENVGDGRVFSDYRVTNPASKRSYRVAIRGEEPGINYCSCPDFATNLLGTCKHVEFVLSRLRARRGGARALRAGWHPEYSSISVVYGALRRVRLRVSATAPEALRTLARRVFDREGWLLPSALARFGPFLGSAARLPHELRVYEDASRLVEEAKAAETRRKTIDRLFTRETGSVAFEGLLKTPLPPYQRAGALFACRAGRAILADEMGLGKTVQAIAAAEIGARSLGVERVLIVCPVSLKHQWQDEIGRFSTRSVEVVGGALRTRQAAYASPSFFKVTSYDTLHTDLGLIEGFAPHLVILDEAQRVKNWSTRAARAVKRIASPMALVLTGTPLENRLEELVSIVQFVDQHRLGPTWRLRHEHQILENGTTRVVGYRNLDRLGQTLRPILLRRRKAEVLPQLPERTGKRLFVSLTAEQRSLHDDNQEIVARIAAKWRRFKFLSDADQKRLTIALQNMRMACDDACLVDPRKRSGQKVEEVEDLLADLLQTEGVKVVVFSQWVKMHELLIERIEAAGWGHVFLHGGVPSADRGALVRRFRDDPECRVFLSTDAGGTGLNLQAASAVINVDLPWNPAVLEQRVGRVHRLGQTRSVQVFDLVAEASIEEGMLSLLGFKKSLFAGVLDAGEPEVLMGGTRLERFIKGIEAVTGSVAVVPAPVAEHEPRSVAAADEPAVLETGRAGSAIPESAAEPPAALGLPGAASASAEPAQSPNEAWVSLLQAGASLLSQLAASFEASMRDEGPGVGGAALERDPSTGEAILRLRLREPEALLASLRTLAGGLRT